MSPGVAILLGVAPFALLYGWLVWSRERYFKSLRPFDGRGQDIKEGDTVVMAEEYFMDEPTRFTVERMHFDRVRHVWRVEIDSVHVMDPITRNATNLVVEKHPLELLAEEGE